MSLINTNIQPFHTTAYHDGKFVPVSDANLKGQWSVVFFYPADFTFVCPTELGDLAGHYDTFKALGVEIYAVSTDTHFAHKAWHDSSDTISKIRYPMLGDATGAISRSFGVICGLCLGGGNGRQLRQRIFCPFGRNLSRLFSSVQGNLGQLFAESGLGFESVLERRSVNRKGRHHVLHNFGEVGGLGHFMLS